VAVHAPKHLSARSKRLYRQLVADYRLDREAAALETLRLALEALDRTEQARAELARNGGPFYVDRFGQPKTHPAAALERDSRLAALRAFRELGLAPEESDDSQRPPRTTLRAVP
jgi:hypothetical protein